MKKLLLLLLLLPFSLSAQEYRLVDPASIYLYDDLNYAIRIDSVDTWSRGYRYHNYRYAPLCGTPESNPNWLQNPLLLDTTLGRYTFLNDEGDSIHWETNTSVGDTWCMVWLTDTTWLQAKHDSTKRDEVFGQMDSVRYYHLQATDSSGQLLSHPWNDSVLRLSDGHGILTMVAMDAFPYGPPHIFELEGMENPDLGAYRLTPRRLYSMPVGGVIHERKDYWHGGATYYPTYYPYRVIQNEFFSKEVLARDESLDSIKITFRETRILEFHVVYDESWNVGKEFDSSSYVYTLTVLEPDEMPLSFEYLSYEYGRWGEIPNSGEMITRLNESWPRSISPFAIALPIVVGKTGIQFNNWDSCYTEIIDVSDSFWGYEGLGMGYYSLGRSYSIETFYPVYYAFPDDTAGTPIDFDSLRQLVTSVPAHEQAAFQVYPNPFEAAVYLEGLPPHQHITAEIFDGMGRLVFQESLSGDSLDLGQLPAGVYVLRLQEGHMLLGQRRIMKR